MAEVRESTWVPESVDWAKLIDEDLISSRRAAAEQYYSNLSTDQFTYIRRRAKTDLFFLANGILEYELLSESFHGHYCQWLKAMWGKQYRMTLKPRGHYKSTVNTIADSVQMALPNCADVLERPYCYGPDNKILLAHENRESASRFLFEITEAFIAKRAMLAFFPECIPSRRVQRINKWELELPRNSHSKEPTFDTIGAGGAAQGRHYNWLKLDDLIGEDARDSDTVMKRIIRWFNNVNSLMARPRFDGWDLTGTHWANNDIYAHAIRIYGVDGANSFIRNYFKRDIERFDSGPLVLYGRAIEEEGVIPFEQEFPRDYVERLKKDPVVFASQYANNPKDTALTLFSSSWLRFYNVGQANRLYVFSGESSWSVDTRDLDICVLIDPSMGETVDADESGFIVTGTDKKLNIFILEAFKKRLKPPEVIDEMLRLYTKWWPRVMSVESVAFSGIYSYWFAEKCSTLRINPNLNPYKVGRREKTARIRGLSSYFAAGQIYMLEGMTQLRDELEWFPLGDSEHILDALAQGPEVWTPGLSRNDMRDNLDAIEQVMVQRDALTGY